MEVDPVGVWIRNDHRISYLAITMHQRFSLNANQGANCLMWISLHLIANKPVGNIFFLDKPQGKLKYQQTLCADAQLNATVDHFADIISLRRWHNSLGPIRVLGEFLIYLKS